MLIVFDLDGTLIDSQRDIADSVNALLEEYQKPPLSLDAVAAMVGDGAAVLVRRVCAAVGIAPRDALERFLAHYDQRLTVHTRPYAGIPEALATLQSLGHALAVLTNKPQRATSTILDRLGLADVFDQAIGGDTPAGRKPDPTGLRQIVAAAGAAVDSTVLVGDSPIDLETSRRAGTRVCLAKYGFGFRFAADAFRGDELFVDDPGELIAVLNGAPRSDVSRQT
jgi:phosphoglycolate phosphatase